MERTNKKFSKITKFYNAKYFIDNPNLGRMISDEQSYSIRGIVARKKYFGDLTVEGKKILDFGCGIGQNTASLCDIAQVDGYDISPFARKYCKTHTKINIVKKLKDKFYDIILLSHSLEHMTNPLDTLLMLKKKLKTNGILIIILPREEFYKGSFELDNDRHLYCWTFQTINNLLKYCKYQILSNDPYYGWGYTKLMPLRKLGFNFYYFCVSLLGKMMKKGGELRIVAKN
jgi:2-polyprenyl-3-methyl-5-hydroxy-6-metoxy-1,4-benzoquinol methylase